MAPQNASGRVPIYRRKWMKIFFGLLSAVVLGALGSGLWEAAIKPMFKLLSMQIINLISFFFEAYKDSIYREASKGFNDESAVFLRIFLYMLMPLIYFFLLLIHPSRYSQKKQYKIAEYFRSTKGYRLLLIITLAVFVSFTIGAVKIGYSNDVATKINDSIKILSAYVENHEQAQLISDFHNMENERDFLRLKDRIQNVAKKHGIDAKKINKL